MSTLKMFHFVSKSNIIIYLIYYKISQIYMGYYSFLGYKHSLLAYI